MIFNGSFSFARPIQVFSATVSISSDNRWTITLDGDGDLLAPHVIVFRSNGFTPTSGNTPKAIINGEDYPILVIKDGNNNFVPALTAGWTYALLYTKGGYVLLSGSQTMEIGGGGGDN